jgi:hypothetical protein
MPRTGLGSQTLGYVGLHGCSSDKVTKIPSTHQVTLYVAKNAGNGHTDPST